MFTNAEMTHQLIKQHRAELIAEADRYRVIKAARRALRARSRRHSDLS
jgi:hypothetical protein